MGLAVLPISHGKLLHRRTFDRCQREARGQGRTLIHAHNVSGRDRLELARKVDRYRDSSQIQFTSQVLPPSSENDCSIRADFGEMSVQT
jgi:hypothetical protein